MISGRLVSWSPVSWQSATVGRVGASSVITQRPSPGVTEYVVRAIPDLSGSASARVRMSGVLYGYRCATVGGSATYSVEVQDHVGHDVLLDGLSSESPGALVAGEVTAQIGSAGDRPVVVLGEHVVEFSGDPATEFELTLIVLDGPGPRLDHDGVTR